MGFRRVPLVRVDMPIQFDCPSCQAALRLKDEYAGRRRPVPQVPDADRRAQAGIERQRCKTANNSKISNATVWLRRNPVPTELRPSPPQRRGRPTHQGRPRQRRLNSVAMLAAKESVRPSSAAGRAVACPGCGQKLRVPGVAPSAAPADVGPAVALGPGPATSPSPFDELSDALLGGNTAASAGFEGGLSASSPQPRGKKKPIGLYVVIGGGALALVVLPVVVFVLFGSALPR